MVGHSRASGKRAASVEVTAKCCPAPSVRPPSCSRRPQHMSVGHVVEAGSRVIFVASQFIDWQRLLVEGYGTGVVPKHVVHYANINQGVALARRSPAATLRSRERSSWASPPTRSPRCTSAMPHCVRAGFTAWFAQLLVDFDGRRAVTGGIRQ